MEKPTKKSSLKPKLQKAKATLSAARHGNPAKKLKIITVTGQEGKDTVATLIHKTLIANNTPSALILSPPTSRPLSAYTLHKFLGKSFTSGADYVVIEAPADLIADHVFHGLPLQMIVLTDTPTPDIEDRILSKSILFQYAPTMTVLNRDDPNYDHFASLTHGSTTATFGRHRDATTRINRSKLYKAGTEANLATGSQNFDIATFLTGEEVVPQMAAAAAAASLLSIAPDTIIEGIASYEPIPEPTIKS